MVPIAASTATTLREALARLRALLARASLAREPALALVDSAKDERARFALLVLGT